MHQISTYTRTHTKPTLSNVKIVTQANKSWGIPSKEYRLLALFNELIKYSMYNAQNHPEIRKPYNYGGNAIIN